MLISEVQNYRLLINAPGEWEQRDKRGKDAQKSGRRSEGKEHHKVDMNSQRDPFKGKGTSFHSGICVWKELWQTGGGGGGSEPLCDLKSHAGNNREPWLIWVREKVRRKVQDTVIKVTWWPMRRRFWLEKPCSNMML